MIAAMNALEVITLYVEDLNACDDFYGKVFTREIIFSDDACSIFRIGNVVINLLKFKSAHELVAPEKVATAGGGSRALYTVNVEDADAVCAELSGLGIALINGPMDRPWGRRTAAFADPAGNVWEVAQELSGT